MRSSQGVTLTSKSHPSCAHESDLHVAVWFEQSRIKVLDFWRFSHSCSTAYRRCSELRRGGCPLVSSARWPRHPSAAERRQPPTCRVSPSQVKVSFYHRRHWAQHSSVLLMDETGDSFIWCSGLPLTSDLIIRRIQACGEFLEKVPHPKVKISS